MVHVGDSRSACRGRFFCWHHSMPFHVGALAPTVMVWLLSCTTSIDIAAPCFCVPMVLHTIVFSSFLSPVIIHEEQLCSYTYRMTERERLQLRHKNKASRSRPFGPGTQKIYPKNTISVYPYINVPCNRIFAAQKPGGSVLEPPGFCTCFTDNPHYF